MGLAVEVKIKVQPTADRLQDVRQCDRSRQLVMANVMRLVWFHVVLSLTYSNFTEGVQRHLQIIEIDTGLIGQYSDLHCIVDHSFHTNK